MELCTLCLSVEDEMHIFLAMLLDENHQLIEVSLVGRCTMFVSNIFVRPVSRMARICFLIVSFIAAHHPAKVCAVCD